MPELVIANDAEHSLGADRELAQVRPLPAAPTPPAVPKSTCTDPTSSRPPTPYIGAAAGEVRTPAPSKSPIATARAKFSAPGGHADPNWASIDPGALMHVERPVLLTQGGQSPAWFREIVARLAALIHGADLHAYPGAGHAPHLTHPNDYLKAATAFLAGRARGR